MTRTKPYSNLPGYRCSLKTPFGHAVVFDLGTDAAPRRWHLVGYRKGDGAEIGSVAFRSERQARTAMKGARDGHYSAWIPEALLPKRLRRLADDSAPTPGPAADGDPAALATTTDWRQLAVRRPDLPDGWHEASLPLNEGTAEHRHRFEVRNGLVVPDHLDDPDRMRTWFRVARRFRQGRQY